MARYKQPFTMEARPGYPLDNGWWAAYKNVDPPPKEYWEGDKLKEYRAFLVETIIKAWKDLAWLVDKAVIGPDN